MKYLKYITLILFIVFLVGVIPSSYKDIRIAKKGYLIQAEIVTMPDKCKGKNIYADFKYTNKVFTKRVWNDFCNNYKLNQKVEFYHIDKYPEDFVFRIHKDTEVYSQFVSAILVTSLFGISSLYLFYKKVVKVFYLYWCYHQLIAVNLTLQYKLSR